jgi:hypothetical protein
MVILTIRVMVSTYQGDTNDPIIRDQLGGASGRLQYASVFCAKKSPSRSVSINQGKTTLYFTVRGALRSLRKYHTLLYEIALSV